MHFIHTCNHQAQFFNNWIAPNLLISDMSRDFLGYWLYLKSLVLMSRQDSPLWWGLPTMIGARGPNISKFNAFIEKVLKALRSHFKFKQTFVFVFVFLECQSLCIDTTFAVSQLFWIHCWCFSKVSIYNKIG